MLVATLALSAGASLVQVWAAQKQVLVKATQNVASLHQNMLGRSIDPHTKEDITHFLNELNALPEVTSATLVRDPDGSHTSVAASDVILALGPSTASPQIRVTFAKLTDVQDIVAAAHVHFAPNLLQTLIAGMLMLVIFDRIAARHLKGIAAQVRSAHWMDEVSPISLERDAGIFPAEIDSIVEALETMRRQAQIAYGSLSRQADEMSVLNSSLQEANREQAELTYALSHELIAPVNTLEMLLVEVGVFSPAISKTTLETICDMQSSTRRMRQQIEAVQTYARLLQEDVMVTDVSLDAILSEVVSRLAPEIDAANASISAEHLGSAQGDQGNLTELFEQVLRNALRYRDPHRDLVITCRCIAGDDPGTVQFAIADTGLGIDPRHQDAVFALFRRLHTQSDIPGNGMGLPICRRVVQRHRGTLKLTSTPGCGTQIEVSLPRSLAA